MAFLNLNETIFEVLTEDIYEKSTLLRLFPKVEPENILDLSKVMYLYHKLSWDNKKTFKVSRIAWNCQKKRVFGCF